METNYTCINCGVPVCNRNSDCSSAVSEEHPGWKMGMCVSLCKTCTPGNSGKTKFQIPCASRGFHKYREIWKPTLGQNLSVRQELSNVHDPFAISISAKIPGKLTKRDIIGHIPREISRFCHYFINYGGAINARVSNVKYRPSPIPSGGLEIPITMELIKENATVEVFRKMDEYVHEYYTEPENLIRTGNDDIDDDDYEDEIVEDGYEEYEEERDSVIEEEETVDNEFLNMEEDVIVID